MVTFLNNCFHELASNLMCEITYHQELHYCAGLRVYTNQPAVWLNQIYMIKKRGYSVQCKRFKL